MKKIFYLLTMLPLFLISCSSGSGSEKGPVYNLEGVALAGYDPVAYFEQGEAKMGTADEVVNYEGLTYYFSSTKNRLLFQENPTKYLPAYGGWCAYAVAEKSGKMEPDPTMWHIQDGKLQLFYDDWMTSITGSLKEEWNTDPENYKRRADANWEKMN